MHGHGGKRSRALARLQRVLRPSSLALAALLLVGCGTAPPAPSRAAPPPAPPPPPPPAFELQSAEASWEPTDVTETEDRWSPRAPVVPREHTRAIVLLYHQFSLLPRAGKVDQLSFERQLTLLEQEGVEVVPLSKLVDWALGKRLLPERVLAITLDDGERPHFTVAYPALKRHQMPFTLAIPTKRIEDGDTNGRVEWPMVRQMMASGLCEVVSHSHTHARMTRLSKKAREPEIVLSKQILERQLGTTVDVFAYPLGAFTDDVLREVQAAGYRAALSVVGRPIDHRVPRFAIPRYELTGSSTVFTLKGFLKQARLLAPRAPRGGSSGGVADPASAPG